MERQSISYLGYEEKTDTMKAGFVELDVDEEIIAIVKKSILLELSRLLFGFIWILLPFFFFFSLMKLELTGILLGLGG